MNCRIFYFPVFAAFLLTALAARTAFAQEPSSAPAQSPAAGSAARPVAPQPAAPTPSPSSTPAAPGGAPNAVQSAPAKRVWTNDDMGSVHRDPSIPEASGSKARPVKTSPKPATGAKQDSKRYQDQIAALRAKLPPLDDKISQLQGVLNGDTVQSTRTYLGNRIDDWHVELVDLQKRRDDIETKIGALQDEARHNGVPENQIPQ
jgi:hypothetical protein